MRNLLCIVLLVGSLVGGVLHAPVYAQRAPGSVGIGAQAGQPGGFTAKTYGRAPWAGVFSLGTNFRDQTVAHAHLLREHPLPESASGCSGARACFWGCAASTPDRAW
ncbi:MAG: hypothetical protein ACQETP_10665 [Bacteroidota bacterium]